MSGRQSGQGLHNRTPEDILRFLKESLNKFNNFGVSTTWVECYRLIPEIETQWARANLQGRTGNEDASAEEALEHLEAMAAEASGGSRMYRESPPSLVVDRGSLALPAEWRSRLLPPLGFPGRQSVVRAGR